MSYRIMIFPNAVLTTGKASDKAQIAKTSGTFGEMREFATLREVTEAVAVNSCSLNDYKQSERSAPLHHRHGDYFIKTNLIGLDIDDHMTIEEAQEILKDRGYRYGLYTSFNHTDEKHKFRVILETSEPITDANTYRLTWESLHREFGALDVSCKDIARLYYHSNPANKLVLVGDGNTVEVVKETAMPTVVTHASNAPQFKVVASELGKTELHFMAMGAKQGDRNSQLYKVLRLCKEKGYDYDFLLNKVPQKLREDADYMRTYGEKKIQDTVDQVWNGISRYDQPQVFHAATMVDPKTFVPRWLEQNGYHIQVTGEFQDREGCGVLTGDLFKYLYLDYVRLVTEHNTMEMTKPKIDRRVVTKHPEAVIRMALDTLILDHIKEQHEALRSRIQYDGMPDYPELKKFSKAITGKEDEVTERVLAHFCWQVKRKICKRKVIWHTMPVLTGNQGNGKSESVRKLVAPLNGFVFTVSLRDSVDRQRFGFALKDNYIAFCDEMEKAERTDIDALKNTITADSMSIRPFYSQKVIDVPQNCTSIGCSNKPLALLLYDPSGMRRFYEIVTDPDMQANGGWDLLAQIDFLKLWREIDENQDTPYIAPVMELLFKHQESLRTPEPFELFIEELSLFSHDGAYTRPVLKDHLYTEYSRWCERNGYKPANSTWFGRGLAKYGILAQGNSGKSRKYYMVSESYTPSITDALE